MSTITVDLSDIAGVIDSFKALPKESAKAASMAINRVASRSGMASIREAIYADANFPKGYLTGDRLRVSRYAKPSSLEAVILARKRATSLARFATGQPIGGRSGVTVSVKPGQSQRLDRAWLVRLNKGASYTEDNYNVGLAMRVGPTGDVAGKRTKHSSWLVPDAVALLYGPSVDQIFRDVADELSGDIGNQLADEYFRQMERIL